MFEQTSSLGSLLNAIAVCILMGTPHARYEEDKLWNSAQLLLKPRGKYMRRQLIRAEDARKLARLSTRFEEAAMDLPILSICETAETNLRGGAFQSSKLMVSVLLHPVTSARSSFSGLNAF